MGKVLLIEPDNAMASLYKKYFSLNGHTVTRCRVGQEAIFAADQAVPDLIIIELQLPGHGGIEFLYEFRSYPDWQKVPVIINTMTPERISALNKNYLGISSYCYKPLTSLRQLLSQVNLALI